LLLEVVELSLSNLLSDNIDIVREVDLLNEFDCKARQQADDYHEERYSPKRCLAENLRSCLVEEYRTGCRGTPYSSPEEYKQDTDCRQKEDEPIPSVCVEKEVHVDNEDGAACNIQANSVAVSNILAAKRYERARLEKEVCREKCNH
jgi:hypothetical protein